MKIAYLDCFAGASGDMLLGALLDAGLHEATLVSELAALNLPGFELHSRKVLKNGFSATQAEVIVEEDVPERHLGHILALVDASHLSGEIKAGAAAIFCRLGKVEAGIHGTTLDEVHLHELGGTDTLVDVVGTLLGLQLLAVEEVHASPLPLGRGFVQGAHGQIPLPGPAVTALLQGVPVVGSPIDQELVTPTGAALITALARSFGPLPAMTLTGVGYGAGSRDLPIPNLLRVFLGEKTVPIQATVEHLVLLQTNIDDLNPQVYDYLINRLLAANALDVTLAPLQMKKNRPATQVTVLCRPLEADSLEAILFAETTTLGVRRQIVERHALSRSLEMVQTPYGPVRIKLAQWAEGKKRAIPEYEDCRLLAENSGVPLWEVMRAAQEAVARLAP